MTITRKICYRLVGTLAVLCAAFGMFFNISVVAGDFGRVHTDEEPYFRLSFYTLSSIAFVVAILVGYGGTRLLRLQRSGGPWVAVPSLLGIAVGFGVGALWLLPKIGMSIAAATGVSLGGLMPMLITLLPLWAWLLTRQSPIARNPPPLT